MKYLIIAALGSALLCTPALAGGHGGSYGHGGSNGHNGSTSQGLGLGAVVTTGKGGLVGTLLGSKGRGNNGLAVNVNAVTGKGGVLGLLLGGHGSSRGHGW